MAPSTRRVIGPNDMMARMAAGGRNVLGRWCWATRAAPKARTARVPAVTMSSAARRSRLDRAPRIFWRWRTLRPRCRSSAPAASWPPKVAISRRPWMSSTTSALRSASSACRAAPWCSARWCNHTGMLAASSRNGSRIRASGQLKTARPARARIGTTEATIRVDRVSAKNRWITATSSIAALPSSPERRPSRPAGVSRWMASKTWPRSWTWTRLATYWKLIDCNHGVRTCRHTMATRPRR